MTNKRNSKKDLISEVEKINDKLHLIELKSEVKGDENHSFKKGENSIKFLLAEYQHIGDIWKYTDARTENALRLYFTAGAILISAAAILYKQKIEIQFLLQIFLFLQLAFMFGSILLLKRITSTFLLKIEYFNSINLIRRYFIDKDSEIENYLLLPCISKSEMNQDSLKKYYDKKSRSVIILTFIIWISLLIASLGVMITYLIIGKKEGVYLFMTISGVLSFIISIILLRTQIKKNMKNKLNNILYRIRDKKEKTATNHVDGCEP